MKTKDTVVDYGDLDEIVSRSKKNKIKDMMDDLGDLLYTLMEKIEKIIFGWRIS